MKGSGALAISDDNHLTTTAPPLPANISTGPPLNDTRNRIHCGGSTGLNYDSCFDAFQTLDHRDVHLPVRVGQRGTGFFAYNLPWRRISGDGRCAFDIIIRGAAKFEVTTSFELNSAALDLMNKCVRDEGQKGGIISGIGKFISQSTHLKFYQVLDVTSMSLQAKQKASASSSADTTLRQLAAKMVIHNTTAQISAIFYSRTWPPMSDRRNGALVVQPASIK
ncbi:MAG: hypothetical protein Q9200_003941 [Gallowayella weberi]